MLQGQLLNEASAGAAAGAAAAVRMVLTWFHKSRRRMREEGPRKGTGAELVGVPDNRFEWPQVSAHSINFDLIVSGAHFI